MDLRTELVKKYEEKVFELEKTLKTTRLEIGEADSGKESRYPTGRVELEDKIQQIENKLFETKTLLKSIKELPADQSANKVLIGSVVTIELDGDVRSFVIINGTGNFNEGILSGDSLLGNALLGKSLGEVTIDTKMDLDNPIKILEIN